jgi:hypothetical protein
VVNVEGSHLSDGGVSLMRLRFVYSAEVLLVDASCVLREGSADARNLGVGVGVITACFC